MILRVGTSGFSYKEWKGSFYPEEMGDDDMLGYYASRLGTVEINNTFYRMPRPQVLERWAAATPDSFRFVLKASQKITHRSRLRADSAGDAVAYLWKVARTLGARLGPILFQTPPNLKCDLARFAGFLAVIPDGCRAAFEFRHDSWRDDAVHDLLEQRGFALCIAETDEAVGPELVETADWGYLRLRRESYSDAQLADWRQRLAGVGWQEAYLFFKHDEGAAPVTALRFCELGETPG